MWITDNLNQDYKQQFTFKHKITEYKAADIHLELFSTEGFEDVVLLNQKDVFYKTSINEEAQMLSFSAYSTHEDPKRALIYGSLNLELAYLLSKLGLKVDMVVQDLEALNVLSGFFPHFKEVMSEGKVKISTSFSSFMGTQFDLVYHLGVLQANELSAIKKMMDKKGIFIYSPSSLPNLALLKANIALATACFNILMPFSLPFSLSKKIYAYASDTYHPLASLLLQKSDMLEDATYYNSRLHESAFILPTNLKVLLKNLVKN
ncbi:hypothetical protein BKH43_01590 [Helicobacter sp. 13S00401-1]|uniref:hypothetical protein n=1 Tax=Helicobacter sp. 13S00401-1 TaxID=1905758 RepID=UPI000BA7A7A5|nr:hypothetical protein [Helicobacter sp. 13S00401-1]PAF51359.1 hypothetical protein BKH43_01590 [Helicobacter sp. 13S00401-1]